MIVAGAFLIGAVLMAWLAPRPLRYMLRTNCDPRVIIVSWLLTLGTVLALTVVSVALLALPGHGGIESLLHELGRCWTDLQHGALPGWEQAVAAFGAALLIATGTRLAYVGLRQTHVRRARRDRFDSLLRVASPGGDDDSVRWLDHPGLIAFSVAGDPGLIAISRGLHSTLSPAALAATVEHERAHLRGRHHLILDIVDAAAAVLPWAPLFREAPGNVRELVELAADTAAVRRYGTEPVTEALQAMTTAPAVHGTLSMAPPNRTFATRRLDRLASNSPPKLHTARNLWCVVAAVLIPAIPVALGIELIVILGC